MAQAISLGVNSSWHVLKLELDCFSSMCRLELGFLGELFDIAL